MSVKLISSQRDLESYNQARRKNLKEWAWIILGFAFTAYAGALFITELIK